MGAVLVITVLAWVSLLIYSSRIKSINKLRHKWLDILTTYHEDLFKLPPAESKEQVAKVMTNIETIVRANLYHRSSYIIDKYEYNVFINMKQIDFKIINEIIAYDRNFRIEKYEVRK